MGTCLLCNREIPESLTLKELFCFSKRQSLLVCPSCLRGMPSLSGTTVCPGCSRKQQSEDYCEDCRKWAKQYPQLIIQHSAFFSYDEEVKDWLHRYKFQGDHRLAGVFRDELKLHKQKNKTAVFVPLPISKPSCAERGFNQCEEMLKQAGIPYPILLENGHRGSKQSEKNRQERLSTEQPFCLLTGYENYLCREIILFDDVYTTGRTLYHAKLLLYEHGFESVTSLSIAR